MRHLSIAVVYLSVILFCGCSGTGNQEEVSHFKIGQEVPMGKLFLKVDRVDRNVDFGEMSELDSKNEAIVVHIEIENKGKSALGFHVGNLIIHDNQGNKYNGFPLGIGNQLNVSRAISMGDRMRGPMRYFVKRGAKGLSLHYVPKNMRNKRFVIDLGQ
ncbi:MAG: DUF4352 domain-containing protein [Chlamydiota bacterium]|nr:DUF4352 domain-containing protein [Chlamydiota bacterium]